MSNLKLTFSWSESRVKILRECLWKYFLHYYQSWEGWYPNAPDEKRQAYILKNMTNLPMWIGSIVHDEIESIIQEIKLGKTHKCRSYSDALNNITQALRTGWVQSKNKKWGKDPKRNINLAEHYYNQEVTENQLNAFKMKAQICIKSFYESSIYKILCDLKPQDWLTLEDFQSFNLKTGEKVAVKIDCGFKHNNKVYLADWKTGKINPYITDPLITYAMYAMKMGWAKKPEDIIIVPVFLAAYPDEKEKAIPHLEINLSHICRQADIIKEEYKILEKAHSNRENLEFFEHTDDSDKCKKCNFRSMCSGAIQEKIEKTPFD